jgi:AAA domain-containing protein
MNPNGLLAVQRAGQLSCAGPQINWLIEGLWTDQAVGILGGEPKCCKSFLALEMALSIASGLACLRQFPVRRQGPVLLFPAEDSLAVVRQRLEGMAKVAGVCLGALAIEVITEPTLRLDLPADRQRLTNTVAQIKPLLLILDPLIRIHRLDENDASQIAGLLSFLRQLQRQFQLAVLVVHHARKDSNGSRPGQALRGSSDLHGWGDSNLYLRRRRDQLTLSTEHRAAPSRDHIPLQLMQTESALTLSILSEPSQDSTDASPTHRVHQIMAQQSQPISLQRLRQLCSLRTATVCAALTQLIQQGLIVRGPKGYQFKPT